MTRWPPEAKDRLRRAALELFTERGYDQVTVTHIAERAGLTRRTFFRHFADKREVLFAGSERLAPEIERRLESVVSEDDSNDVLHVLAEAGALVLDEPDAHQRRAVIADSNELQERDRSKTAAIAAAISRALTRRGLSDGDASLLGSVYAEAFRSAYDRALADGGRSYADHLAEAIGVISRELDEHRRVELGALRQAQGT